jgi:hypothetical protein
VDRPDHPLPPPVVVHRPPRRRDATRHRALLDGYARPQTFEQLLLADEPLAVLDQVAKHLEDLALQADERVAPPELLAGRIQRALTEEVEHGG